MNYNWIKWGTVVASTVITLNLANLKPAQAAEFNFKIGNETEGSLVFEESPLKKER